MAKSSSFAIPSSCSGNHSAALTPGFNSPRFSDLHIMNRSSAGRHVEENPVLAHSSEPANGSLAKSVVMFSSLRPTTSSWRPLREHSRVKTPRGALEANSAPSTIRELFRSIDTSHAQGTVKQRCV